MGASDGQIRQEIGTLFEHWAHEKALSVEELGANGSNRRYFRVGSSTRSCIAAYNGDVRENRAFITYSREMCRRGLRVPEVYAVNTAQTVYLQTDLGDTTLYDCLRSKKQRGGGFDAEMLELYKRVLDDLVVIQTSMRDIDFTVAYPRSDFDRQSMMWDLQYFKYFYLKLVHQPFDEQLLEDDFGCLVDYLLQEDCGYFMYRDFQSRNIMLVPSTGNTGGKDSSLFSAAPYYIDFQGGRRGAAQYDVASLLYSAKSDIPEALRLQLLDYYVESMSRRVAAMPESARPRFDAEQFRNHFFGYVLVRVLQAMGAYGYRGYFERKDYFLQSIPLALANLRLLVSSHWPPVELPHLKEVLTRLAESTPAEFALPSLPSDRLTVTVSSFSYKKGLPEDKSGNGGGFIFDCRALPNPGRYPEFRTSTGRDANVIAFLKAEKAVDSFLDHVAVLVSQSVECYMERHFSHLAVSFGCTGGQHRSVYCAEWMADYLRKHYDCDVMLCHREQNF